MNAIQNDAPEIAPSAELARSPPLLRTLVAVDLVESTALTDQLGDRSIADIMHLLDRHARDLLERHGGIEIDKTDGFLLMFERPIPAVAFALDYQRLLHDMSLSEFLPLKARIGIHVGDVVLWRNAANDVARGAKPMEVEGLVKPVAARLAGLALPGQILLSGVARALALRAQDELKIDFPPEWRMHGRYIFKGVGEPVPVFEVGEVGIAPLRSPAYSSKAFREVPWFRRPALLAIEAAVLLAAIVIPAWVFLRSPPVIAFGERDWVVVGSLRNLTEERRLDNAVDTAIRLGLEQSRYVNVVPALRVRDTVSLMKRDPNSTLVDRTIGSEVATRDGARALILPTVSEVGHSVRVTAEVIDPQTQATVYTESADGVGADSVFASADLVSQQLRERLGEALASVSKNSKPLDKVATGNLDALRAYSLAIEAYQANKFAESTHLVREALTLDANFALAHVHLARLLLTVDDQRPAAIQEMQKALEFSAQLNPRDSLYIKSWLGSLKGPPRESLQDWKTLATLYPDFYTGRSLYAYYSFNLANRSDGEVLSAAEVANAPQYPHAAPAKFLLANMYLVNEQYRRSAEKFLDAEKEGGAHYFSSVLPYVAQRDYARMDAILSRGDLAALGSVSDLERSEFRIAIAYDRGQVDHAMAILGDALSEASKRNPRYISVFRGIEVSLRSRTRSDTAVRAALADYIGIVRKTLSTTEESERPDARFQLLFAAYLCAELGDTVQARALMSEASEGGQLGNWPLLEKLSLVAQAELLIKTGHADQAAALLKPSLDGSELYLAHAALMDAYVADGHDAEAIEQAKWLAAARGRAYGEPSVRTLLMPLNVALSNAAQAYLDAHQHAAKPALARASE